MATTIAARPRPARYATTASLRVVVPADRPALRIKLFHETEDRESSEYGPYVFVQTMYGVMRGILAQDPRTEEVVAEYNPATGLWRAQDRHHYTDVVCWTAAASTNTSKGY